MPGSLRRMTAVAMETKALFVAHRGFFDLGHIRRVSTDFADAPDAQVIAAVLDPDQTAPPAPNRIFDVHHYTQHLSGLGTDRPANPVLHYLTKGAEQGRSINALFDKAFYARNARVLDPTPLGAVLHALAHFDIGLAPFSPFVDASFLAAETGRDRDPAFLSDLFQGRVQHDRLHPLVDLTHLRAQFEARLDTVQDVIRHYWTCGVDLSTHPLFDVDHYKSQVAGGHDLAHSAYHYLTAVKPQSPHPLFDPDFYDETARALLGRVPGARLEHFITVGDALGLSPSPYFDTAFYRARSKCDGNAVVHYLAGGHRHFAPHPMFDLCAGQLLDGAQQASGKTAAVRMATRPHDVPPSLTPDFSAGYYRKQVPDAGPGPEDLRAHYFRHGFPAGRRPNGLISIPYVKAQCGRAGIDQTNPLAVYFERGWHRRSRILLVLPTMDDTVGNRAILGMCAAQLDHPDLEIVVASAMPGPLSASFYEVAHVWHLASQLLAALDPEALQNAVRRLGEAMAANPARAALVDCSEGMAIVQAIASLELKLAVFGDEGLSQLSGIAAAGLADLADLVLCDSDTVARALTRVDGARRIALAPGLMIDRVRVRVPPLAATRARTRTALGLDAAAVLILSSGAGSLADGADLFGALAALCADEAGVFDRAIFVWHGPARVPPNTPLFYAAHFARLAAGGGAQFRQVDSPGIDAVLAASDIYIDLGRDGGGSAGAARAKSQGLTVLTMDSPANATGPDAGAGNVDTDDVTVAVGRYDIAAARDALRRLVADAQSRARGAAGPQGATDPCTSLSHFIARTGAAIARLAPDVTLQDATRPSFGRMLVVLPDKPIFEALTDFAKRTEVKNGAPILWFDLAHQSLPDLPAGIAALIHESACREIAVARTAVGLDARDVAGFDRSVWFARGGAGELSALYALGQAFDRVVTSRPSQIEEMHQINPHVAALMSVLDWVSG